MSTAPDSASAPLQVITIWPQYRDT
jgi:hypothetical protein